MSSKQAAKDFTIGVRKRLQPANMARHIKSETAQNPAFGEGDCQAQKEQPDDVPGVVLHVQPTKRRVSNFVRPGHETNLVANRALELSEKLANKSTRTKHTKEKPKKNSNDKPKERKPRKPYTKKTKLQEPKPKTRTPTVQQQDSKNVSKKATQSKKSHENAVAQANEVQEDNFSDNESFSSLSSFEEKPMPSSHKDNTTVAENNDNSMKQPVKEFTFEELLKVDHEFFGVVEPKKPATFDASKQNETSEEPILAMPTSAEHKSRKEPESMTLDNSNFEQNFRKSDPGVRFGRQSTPDVLSHKPFLTPHNVLNSNSSPLTNMSSSTAKRSSSKRKGDKFLAQKEPIFTEKDKADGFLVEHATLENVTTEEKFRKSDPGVRSEIRGSLESLSHKPFLTPDNLMSSNLSPQIKQHHQTGSKRAKKSRWSKIPDEVTLTKKPIMDASFLDHTTVDNKFYDSKPTFESSKIQFSAQSFDFQKNVFPPKESLEHSGRVQAQLNQEKQNNLLKTQEERSSFQIKAQTEEEPPTAPEKFRRGKHFTNTVSNKKNHSGEMWGSAQNNFLDSLFEEPLVNEKAKLFDPATSSLHTKSQNSVSKHAKKRCSTQVEQRAKGVNEYNAIVADQNMPATTTSKRTKHHEMSIFENETPIGDELLRNPLVAENKSYEKQPLSQSEGRFTERPNVDSLFEDLSDDETNICSSPAVSQTEHQTSYKTHIERESKNDSTLRNQTAQDEREDHRSTNQIDSRAQELNTEYFEKIQRDGNSTKDDFNSHPISTDNPFKSTETEVSAQYYINSNFLVEHTPNASNIKQQSQKHSSQIEQPTKAAQKQPRTQKSDRSAGKHAFRDCSTKELPKNENECHELATHTRYEKKSHDSFHISKDQSQSESQVHQTNYPNQQKITENIHWKPEENQPAGGVEDKTLKYEQHISSSSQHQKFSSSKSSKRRSKNHSSVVSSGASSKRSKKCLSSTNDASSQNSSQEKSRLTDVSKSSKVQKEDQVNRHMEKEYENPLKPTGEHELDTNNRQLPTQILEGFTKQTIDGYSLAATSKDHTETHKMENIRTSTQVDKSDPKFYDVFATRAQFHEGETMNSLNKQAEPSILAATITENLHFEHQNIIDTDNRPHNTQNFQPKHSNFVERKYSKSKSSVDAALNNQKVEQSSIFLSKTTERSSSEQYTTNQDFSIEQNITASEANQNEPQTKDLQKKEASSEKAKKKHAKSLNQANSLEENATKKSGKHKSSKRERQQTLVQGEQQATQHLKTSLEFKEPPLAAYHDDKKQIEDLHENKSRNEEKQTTSAQNQNSNSKERSKNAKDIHNKSKSSKEKSTSNKSGKLLEVSSHYKIPKKQTSNSKNSNQNDNSKQIEQKSLEGNISLEHSVSDAYPENSLQRKLEHNVSDSPLQTPPVTAKEVIKRSSKHKKRRSSRAEEVSQKSPPVASSKADGEFHNLFDDMLTRSKCFFDGPLEAPSERGNNFDTNIYNYTDEAVISDQEFHSLFDDMVARSEQFIQSTQGFVS